MPFQSAAATAATTATRGQGTTLSLLQNLIRPYTSASWRSSSIGMPCSTGFCAMAENCIEMATPAMAPRPTAMMVRKAPTTSRFSCIHAPKSAMTEKNFSMAGVAADKSSRPKASKLWRLSVIANLRRLDSSACCFVTAPNSFCRLTINSTSDRPFSKSCIVPWSRPIMRPMLLAVVRSILPKRSDRSSSRSLTGLAFPWVSARLKPSAEK